VSELLSSENERNLCEFLVTWSDRFPEVVEHFASNNWKLTQLLSDLGSSIARGSYRSSSIYMLFLMMVGVWKNPHAKALQDTLANILKNSIKDVEQQFSDALKIYDESIKDKNDPSKQAERNLVDALGRLSGLGASPDQESRKVVSAVLRFLDPSKYGTVDWRNWCILSNTDSTLLPSPLLNKLGDTVEKTKPVPIDTEHYLSYLDVIRSLARRCSLTPAQVDMALFAYSNELWHFPGYASRMHREKSLDKAAKIMSVVEEIVQEVSKLPGQRWRAIKFQQVMKGYAKSGDYLSMFEYAKNITKKGRPPVGAKKTLESEFSRIEQITRDP
jgi:hypothetical protein